MTVLDQIVEPSWLARPSTEVASELVGCTLVRQLPSAEIIRGLIVETEAYAEGDPAFHAYTRRTERNAAVFGPPGTSYVYLIYGIHHCFNVVTELEGIPSAVLIRALQLPTLETDITKSNRQRLAAGPGKLCQVMQIDRSLNGIVLQPGKPLWLEHRSTLFQAALERKTMSLNQTTRIGISKGIDLPWRWYLNNCAAVSRR